MRIPVLFLAAACLLATVPAQYRAERPTAAKSKLDPRFQKIVREISATNIEATIRKLVSFHTRHTMSDTDNPTQGIGAARNWIKAEFERYAAESGGRLKVAFDEFVQPPGIRLPVETKIVNVVATLPGTRPESAGRMYVVSGHYDSRASNPNDAKSAAPGANDDASGTAAVMEMARVMSKYEFDATIVFMTVAAEEQGLLGAAHWAEEAKRNKLDVGAMFTNDIIGSSRSADGKIDNRRVRLFAEGISLPALQEASPEMRTLVQTGGENDTPTRQLARYIKEQGERYVPGMTVSVVYRRDRYLRGGDHLPFLERGFPAVRFTEPSEDYRHQHQDIRKEKDVQYGDLPEFVDFAYVAQVARINAAALANLASAPAPPANVAMETIKLENDTTLRWDANKEADLAGYRVVWRETTSPFWQHSRDVGNVTRFTLPGFSKDDFLFGVQAVDKDGHASLAVYPVPYRPQPR